MALQAIKRTIRYSDTNVRPLAGIQVVVSMANLVDLLQIKETIVMSLNQSMKDFNLSPNESSMGAMLTSGWGYSNEHIPDSGGDHE